MIEIKQLTETDMYKAMYLKVLCWSEELAGRSEATLSFEKELEFWMNWMHTANEHDDIRLLIGAFENGELLGVAFGSLAEIEDIKENGIELNGLWVYPKHRNRGISLMLLVNLLDYFLKLKMKQIIIYNFHYSPSNTFYRKFGSHVLREEVQMKEKVPVDVFVCDIKVMKEMMEHSLLKYITK